MFKIMMTKCIHSRLGPHLQTMMKNLMRSRGCGVLLPCSAVPERCTTPWHSWVLRNTRTSLGSKGTSELHSSSLEERRRGSSKEAKGVVIGSVFTHNTNTSKWYYYRRSKFNLLWGTQTGGSFLMFL